MSMFGLEWWCDDTKEAGATGGVIVEFGGSSVTLTEPEIMAALKAAEAVRNGVAIVIDSNGEVLEMAGRHEKQVKAAIMCLEESQGASTPFFELVSHLLLCASHSHLTKKSVDSAMHEFNLNWDALNDAVTHLAKHSPAILNEALASISPEVA